MLGAKLVMVSGGSAMWDSRQPYGPTLKFRVNNLEGLHAQSTVDIRFSHHSYRCTSTSHTVSVKKYRQTVL